MLLFTKKEIISYYLILLSIIYLLSQCYLSIDSLLPDRHLIDNLENNYKKIIFPGRITNKCTFLCINLKMLSIYIIFSIYYMSNSFENLKNEYETSVISALTISLLYVWSTLYLFIFNWFYWSFLEKILSLRPIIYVRLTQQNIT